ncbi:MAG TPA: hypothetical protein VGE13_03240 [Candidatus Saccharimonadales bacterium]
MTNRKETYPIFVDLGLFYVLSFIAFSIYLAMLYTSEALIRDVLVIIGISQIVASFFQLFTNYYARRTRMYLPMPDAACTPDWPSNSVMLQYGLRRVHRPYAYIYTLSVMLVSFIIGLLVAGLLP